MRTRWAYLADLCVLAKKVAYNVWFYEFSYLYRALKHQVGVRPNTICVYESFSDWQDFTNAVGIERTRLCDNPVKRLP
jgi:hypothetical protein